MRIRGRILAGMAMGPMTANERRLGRYIRDGEGHPSGGGGGGAAGLLDDDAGGGGDQGGGQGGGDQGGGGGDQGGGGGDQGGGDQGGASDLAWASGISAEKAEGEELSNKDWLAKRGYKDFDGVVRDARNLERSVRESGKVKIPGADAKPEEVKAFREAVGVPAEASGYEVDLPQTEGEDGKFELDTAFLDPMRKIAHDNNVPAAAFKAMAAQFVTAQMEQMRADIVARDTARDDKVKEWGAEAAGKKADFRRGAQLLELDAAAIGRLQTGDVGMVMDVLAKIGSLSGEDFFGSGGRQNFGVTSLDEAQKQLDVMTADKAVYEKLKAKDPETTQRYNRLTSAVAHFKSREAANRG